MYCNTNAEIVFIMLSVLSVTKYFDYGTKVSDLGHFNF